MSLAPCTNHIPRHTFGKGWHCAVCDTPVTAEGKPSTYLAQHYMRFAMEAKSVPADLGLTANVIIDAAVQAYKNANSHIGYADEERMGARAAVRDVMVRLGLYDQFATAIRELAKEEG